MAKKSPIAKKTPAWPVVEIFGPTIQGEGVDQGVISHFVRFGGCDFRCDWCDTPYAVVPKEVKQNSTRMGVREILADLKARGKAPWVILTGGNPALHDLGPLVEALQDANYLVAVETQGSKWRNWLREVDRLCLSPKPPSAMYRYDFTTIQRFFNEALEIREQEDKPYEWMFLKIPIFDAPDLAWAVKIRKQLSGAILYLSAGNDAGRTVGSPNREDPRDLQEIRGDLLRRASVLTARVFEIPDLCVADVMVQTQFHVLMWGNEKGK
jgi:7-carboxy-7-deazaguanine synthase